MKLSFEQWLQSKRYCDQLTFQKRMLQDGYSMNEVLKRWREIEEEYGEYLKNYLR